MASLPLLFGGTGSAPTIQTLALSEESPRIIKRFGPSNLIADQVPDFINRDHEDFRSFLETYYEWLERAENPFGIIDGFMDLMDVDKSLSIFFLDFRETYLKNFPYQLATDSSGNLVSEANFIKNARAFYGAKGTEKAYKFLFRLLYNATAEIYYPTKDILRTSAGRWIEPISIKTTNVGGTANYAVEGSQVYQLDPVSGEVIGSGVVKQVVQYQKQYYNVCELFLKDLVGDFVPNQAVVSTVSSFNETVYPVVSSVEVITGGSNYSKTDDVVIGNSGDGVGLSVAIELLDEEGEIKTLRIIDSGVGYQANKVSISVATNTGSGFSATPVVGGVTNYTGYYANNDGKLSSNKRMFDGSYYQDFSYVLRSEIAFSRYRETYKKLIHPAGFKMFGEVLIKRNLVDSLPFHSEFQRYEIPYIGHYTPYRMGTTADLYYLYTSGFNPRGNTFNSYQNYGSSGGKLIITPVGFTFTAGMTFGSIAASGSNGNIISANVFEFAYMGPTQGALLLKTIDFNLLDLGSITGGGFVEGSTLTLVGGSGNTATIQMVRFGHGIVPETGGFTHNPQGRPLGSSLGVEGYIEAQGFSYSYWGIYHHPNIRGIVGLTNMWQGGTGVGASFGAVCLKPFFKMPIGYHFHSNPAGTPYLGTTGANNEYGLIESSTLVSPNF
jgi:hypothetical protein